MQPDTFVDMNNFSTTQYEERLAELWNSAIALKTLAARTCHGSSACGDEWAFEARQCAAIAA